MARKRRLNGFQAGELNLTAMIDVAFQLLAFFILTGKPLDVIAALPANRPSPDPTPIVSNVTPITITVFPGGYTVNGANLTMEQIDKKLEYYSKIDLSQLILIQCIGAAAHGKFIDVLDNCAKYDLKNISVLSSGGG